MEKEELFTAEKMIVSVGREANTEGIGLENTEIEVENGFIKDRKIPNKGIIIYMP